MSRAKPYRSKPTRDFMIYYDIALQSRYYLVQENGPTKLTLEASNKKKYKISVGSDISCSCGGGRTEHCVHTIYALIKIFRIEEGDPLIWQLSFTDTELDKILEKRERNLLRNRNAGGWQPSNARGIEDQYRDAMEQLRADEGWRDRNAQLNLNSPDIMGDADPRRQGRVIGSTGIRIGGGGAPPGKNWAENATQERPIKPPRPLEEEEMCCVCCDTLRENEDLSHCRYGCGRQIHTECLMRCFKHNEGAGKPLNCPLCRTNWGPMGLQILKENTKIWREKKKDAAMANNKTTSVQQMINGATTGAAAAASTGQKIGGGASTNDRGFKCVSCKRQLLYEGKFQCMVCPEVAICKLCFGVKYHEQHEFLTRPQPDKDWEPAFRNNNPSQYNDQYQKVMAELQDRELGPEDYDLLLSLENKQNVISVQRFLAMGFEKTFKPPQSYFDIPKAYCAFCEAEIVDRQTGLQLKNCAHHTHKTCLQDIFTLKNECPLCEQKILDGYEACLNAPKIKANKVTKALAPKPKKKTNIDGNLNEELYRQAQQNVALQFGIDGTNFASMDAPSVGHGRRDLFNLPGASNAPGAGRGRGVIRNAPGRPPLQNRRVNNFQQARQQEEAKTPAATSALATAPGFAGGFNLAGTQIGGTPATQSTAADSMVGGTGIGRKQNGLSFRQRPHSLNNRFMPPEEEKKSTQLELNATGMGRGRFGGSGAMSAASATGSGFKNNKHRLAKDMQQYQELSQEEVLDNMQERFDNAMRDKKVKESIVKRQREQALNKVKLIGKDAPLKKYYREQINNKPSMAVNATGLQTALQSSQGGFEMTQTQIATGQTPRNVLQESAMQITGNSNQSNKRKPQLIRGTSHQMPPTGGPAASNPSSIRVGSGNRATRKQWNSNSRQQITNARAPLRNNSKAPVDPDQFREFVGDVGDMQPMVRKLNNKGSVRRGAAAAGGNLANCGLIAGAIPTNDPIFSDGMTGGGVNSIHANLENLGIFGAQVER